MLTIPIKQTNNVKLKRSPVIIAPAVARPHTIARNLLILNSLLSTFTSLSFKVPKPASTWVSVLLMAMIVVKAKVLANMKRLRGARYRTISPKGMYPNNC